jgi:hypothetical protein
VLFQLLTEQSFFELFKNCSRADFQLLICVCVYAFYTTLFLRNRIRFVPAVRDANAGMYTIRGSGAKAGKRLTLTVLQESCRIDSYKNRIGLQCRVRTRL